MNPLIAGLILIIGFCAGAGCLYLFLRQRPSASSQLLALQGKQVRQLQAEQLNLTQRYESRIRELEASAQVAVDAARKSSVAQSRRTLKGQMAEQMVPLLHGFPFLPADARFLGDPIDYVVFRGCSDVRDGAAAGEALEIVLVDIKQGQSALSPVQRAIARAVDAGRVRFQVIRVDDAGGVEVQAWPAGKAMPMAN